MGAYLWPNLSKHWNIARLKLFPLLLLWPLAEIAGFVLVGREIGVLPTIGLVLLSGVVGAILMRYQGFGVLTRIQTEMAAGRDPGRDIAHGVMILLAGLLLFLPGFVSDILGLALFIPPVRDAVWNFLRKRVNISVMGSRMGAGGSPGGGRRYPGEDGKTIDLDEADYSAAPNPNSPWRDPDNNGRLN